MEFTKEISFDEKLTADKVAKINYHGKLLDTYSDQISIVYGFGQNWDHTQEKQMVKTDAGYEVEVPMESYDTFNFCFKDGNNNWDNNSQFNYISPIERANSSSGTGSSGGKKDDIKESQITNSYEGVANSDEEDSSQVNVELADIEAELTRIFDELFAASDEENENIQLAKSQPAEEPTDGESDEGELSDIEEIFNMLFKEAGYNYDYQTYKAEMMKIQEIHDNVVNTFNELFGETSYETNEEEKDSIQQESNESVQVIQETKDTDNLDDLVEEILKPLSEQHATTEDESNSNQISTVDDFDGIDVKDIELEDINNFEIDDSTKDELQRLIEEIDSQIAMFEEEDIAKEENKESVEDSIANIDETIQVPEISNFRLSDEDPNVDTVKTPPTDSDDIDDSDVNIDELFDFLKKYDEQDEEDEEDTVESSENEESVENKLSLFDESDELEQERVEEHNEEKVGADVKVATSDVEQEEEKSIFEKVKEQKEEKSAETQDIAVSSRKLTAFYRITKKIKLAFIKIFYGIPKMLGKSNSNNDE